MNYVISICNPKALETLTDICQSLDLPMSVVMHGKGTAVRSMLDILGIEDNEKRIVFTIANSEKTKEFMEEQKQRLFIGVPGHGIVISVPVKSIGGGKTVAYLNNGDRKNAKYIPKTEFSYELIVVIANEGRTDLVMNAARSVGATGGTVLHGKGTMKKDSEKFFNVSIAQEKEVILILSKASQKTAIMGEILKKAGPDSDAGTICFSMPVSDVLGFGIK